MILRKGQIVDASLVQADRKKRPSGNTEQKSSQQDADATVVRRGNKTTFGYKGHIGMDQRSGIIYRARFRMASVHDSQERDKLIAGDEQAIFGDKGYANTAFKRECRAKGVYYGILDKGKHGRPKLSTRQKKRNTVKNSIRAAVERPFAHFKWLMGFRRTRYVNHARNELHIMFLCMIEKVLRSRLCRENYYPSNSIWASISQW